MELSEVISVRFPKSVVDALRARYEAEGILPSETIRRAVITVLKHEQIRQYAAEQQLRGPVTPVERSHATDAVLDRLRQHDAQRNA
jgi:metal-responsive CopG/Arc/MetJ family transcriptional regulator